MREDSRPRFDGSIRRWLVWETQFLARADRKQFYDVMTGIIEIPKDSEVIEETTSEGRKKLHARRMNALGYEDLVTSIDTEKDEGLAVFQIVKNSRNEDYKRGNCKIAWDAIVAKYSGSTTTSKVVLKKDFNKSEMGEYEDPTVYITKMEGKRARMLEAGIEVSNEDFFIHIIGNLPEQYDIEAHEFERIMDSGVKNLSIEYMKNKTKARYDRINLKNLEIQGEDESEKALYSSQFKGRCYKCGEYGHKAINCKADNNISKPRYNNHQSQKHFQSRFNGRCNYCGRYGHKAAECYKKQRDSQARNQNNKRQSSKQDDKATVVLMGVDNPENKMENMWIGDTGASCHMTNDDTNMYDVQTINETIETAGEPSRATKIGKLDLMMYQGLQKITITLEKVKYIPRSSYKLFSITAAIGKGCQLRSEGSTLIVETGKVKLKFETKIKTHDGFVMGMKLKEMKKKEICVPAMHSGREVDVNGLHRMLGHVSMDRVKKTGEFYGWRVTGQARECEGCMVAKAKQKNTKKTTMTKSIVPGERLFVDISGIKGTSYGSSKFWLLVVDDATDYCWTFPLKKKSDLGATMMRLVKELLSKEGIMTRFVRCDNAGENYAFKRMCENEGIGIQFEFTAVETPQHNGRVERKFASLYAKVRAVMNEAGFTQEMRDGLWSECASTMTDHENIMTSKLKPVPSHNLLFGKDAKYVRHMKTFGEVGVTKITGSRHISKLANRGEVKVFVGYAKDHDKDVYRMFNMKTRKVSLTRDVRWLSKLFGDYKNIKEKEIIKVSDERESNKMNWMYESEDEVEADEEKGEANDDKERVQKKIANEMKKLSASFNPEATRIAERLTRKDEIEIEEEDYSDEEEIIFERAGMAFLMKDPGTPTNFEEAWNHPKKEDQEKWRTAIKKEFDSMNERQVWKIIKKSEVPDDRRCVKCKWVWNTKRNGVF